MSNPSKSTKLRFALITEEALEKLRPRSQSPTQQPKEMGELIAIIHNTVNQLLDQKLKELNLDHLIEMKINALCERERARYAAQLHTMAAPPPMEMGKVETEDSGMKIQNAISVKSKNLRLRKDKKIDLLPQTCKQLPLKAMIQKQQQHQQQQSTRSRPKKVIPTVPAPVPRNQAYHLPKTNNDPSILTVAAKYLEDINESRRHSWLN
ncbi:uncharacterized protein LOC115629695 [Scaptodrosophila lebanonensis]|uniref:Uncharacterized protein LOC115629695 n=1 Tax=Drosophila lebanonensis TaxID=7225 RepID=A0A6J2U034_DROLE|nr:uncharacterized protein LOC115629695 [Scaptodrosophila lebanonensis]